MARHVVSDVEEVERGPTLSGGAAPVVRAGRLAPATGPR